LTALLSVEHLTVRFGASTVVDDVSLTIDAGEKFALVGESGSGKSITALSVLGLVDGASTSGRIVFDGNDLRGFSEPRMRAIRGGEIAMIFQEPMTALNPLHTIGAQIVEVLRLHEKLGRGEARDRAIALLDRTGIPEPARRVDAWPHQLSGGQRQRAMIAMALACKPRLLIADEPTTALDVTIQAQILALLDELQAELGMALLFITHDLNLVRRFTHRVGVMERGKLVETGRTAAVFASPQHRYTQALLASRPKRAVAAVDVDAPVLVEAREIRVSFEVSHGGFRRRRFDAVRRATLSLRRGETLGIVGESGSGKTTLGLALLALQPIAAGRGDARRHAHRRRRPRHAARDAAPHPGRLPGSFRLAQPAHDDRPHSSARAWRCIAPSSAVPSAMRWSCRCSRKLASAPARASPACSTVIRTNSRAASASASRSRARSSCAPRCSSSTSRRRPSTSRCSARCSRCSASCSGATA
jgi:ABC-type microcin C transport system duplicated ATPase subunit YejF